MRHVTGDARAARGKRDGERNFPISATYGFLLTRFSATPPDSILFNVRLTDRNSIVYQQFTVRSRGIPMGLNSNEIA